MRGKRAIFVAALPLFLLTGVSHAVQATATSAVSAQVSETVL